MFDSTSRYRPLETAHHQTDAGRTIAYKRRRFLPRGEMMTTLAEVTVVDGDRLDLVAARTIGRPEQFWRICDKENAMRPRDLEDTPGRVVRVPVPQVSARCSSAPHS